MLKHLVLAASLAAAPVLAQNGGSASQNSGPDAEMFKALLQRHDVPGLSYAELRNCDVVATQTIGMANIAEGRAVDDTTLFEAASLSKPVFAWIVMDLERNGVIDLDRPFADFGFDWPRIEDKERYARLTPRLVLTHRTGLPNWTGDSLNPARTDPLEFRFDPDTEHSYSGEAIQLLQRFVEHMTGKSLGTLLRERLGVAMPHSSFNHDYAAGTSTTRGYDKASTPDEGDRDMMPVGDVELAAASLATTAADYAAFMGLHCRGEGLPLASYAEMLRAQTPERTGDDGFPIAWGLGWSLVTIEGRKFVMHTGNNGEYRAFAGFYPDNGEGLVLLTNGKQGTALINDFLGLADAP